MKQSIIIELMIKALIESERQIKPQNQIITRCTTCDQNSISVNFCFNKPNEQ